MHFIRPRRTRLWYRYNTKDYWVGAKSALFNGFRRERCYIKKYYGGAIKSLIWTKGRHSSAKEQVAVFRVIRGQGIEGYDENQLLQYYFDGEGDPYIKEKIIHYCYNEPSLQHITADYLERVAKLRLFL
jgi:hypothetical protein